MKNKHSSTLWGKFSMSTISVVATFIILIVITPIAQALSDNNIFNLSNNERSAGGLTAYTWNSKLASAAYNKAVHMCTNDYWAHTAPDGTSGWTFMANAGYAYVTAGENLASGYTQDSALVSGWMQSSGHRVNVMSSTYYESGVGSYYCATGVNANTTIVVAMYGSRGVAPAPVSKPAPAPAPAPKPVTKSVPQAKPVSNATANAKPINVPVPEVKPVETPETLKIQEIKESELEKFMKYIAEYLNSRDEYTEPVNSSEMFEVIEN